LKDRFNLNLALEALRKKDYLRAEEYLEKVKDFYQNEKTNKLEQVSSLYSIKLSVDL
jgi:hypothetical protein